MAGEVFASPPVKAVADAARAVWREAKVGCSIANKIFLFFVCVCASSRGPGIRVPTWPISGWVGCIGSKLGLPRAGIDPRPSRLQSGCDKLYVIAWRIIIYTYIYFKKAK